MNFKYNKVFFLYVFFTGVGIYLLTTFMMPPELKEIHKNPLHIAFDLALFISGSIIILKGNSLINCKINSFCQWNKTPFRRLIIQVFGNTIFTASLVFILFILIHAINKIPPETYIDQYKKLLLAVLALFFFYQSAYLGIFFFAQWKESLIETEKLKFESLHSQLHALQSQANPHFLFNSLNVLTTLIETSPKTAVCFVQRLAEVYRYVLQKMEVHLVELKDELNFIHSYVFLQQNRFGNHLKTEINIPDQMYDYFVPPYTLQILFENAIKHNIISSEKPLLIKLYVIDNNLVVENNLQPKLSLVYSAGVGLKNIKERYEILSAGSIEVIKDEKSFKVIVPLVRNRSIYESVNN